MPCRGSHRRECAPHARSPRVRVEVSLRCAPQTRPFSLSHAQTRTHTHTLQAHSLGTPQACPPPHASLLYTAATSPLERSMLAFMMFSVARAHFGDTLCADGMGVVKTISCTLRKPGRGGVGCRALALSESVVDFGTRKRPRRHLNQSCWALHFCDRPPVSSLPLCFPHPLFLSLLPCAPPLLASCSGSRAPSSHANVSPTQLLSR